MASTSSLPSIDQTAVQKWYDDYIESFSKHDPARLADKFFTYPVVMGSRLVLTRDEMHGIFKKTLDSLINKRKYSHSVMTPVQVTRLSTSNNFILTTSGKRFKTDGSLLE